MSHHFSDGEEDVASEIHEKNFATAFSVVVIDSVDDVAIGIVDGAAICVVNKRFHPNREGFCFVTKR